MMRFIRIVLCMMWAISLFSGCASQEDAAQGNQKITIKITETRPDNPALPEHQEASADTRKQEIPSVSSLLRPRAKDYRPEEKADPFKPLPWVSTTKSEELKPAHPEKCPDLPYVLSLSPLERIHLSQLKLTGVTLSEDRNIALLEDASGTPYIVSRGTKIGTNRGMVAEIQEDRVVIKEEIVDEACNISIRYRDLKLQGHTGRG